MPLKSAFVAIYVFWTQLGGQRALSWTRLRPCWICWLVSLSRTTISMGTVLFYSHLYHVLSLSPPPAQPFLSVFLRGWRRNNMLISACRTFWLHNTSIYNISITLQRRIVSPFGLFYVLNAHVTCAISEGFKNLTAYSILGDFVILS